MSFEKDVIDTDEFPVTAVYPQQDFVAIINRDAGDGESREAAIVVASTIGVLVQFDDADLNAVDLDKDLAFAIAFVLNADFEVVDAVLAVEVCLQVAIADAVAVVMAEFDEFTARSLST